jgi:hypothetical protein
MPAFAPGRPTPKHFKRASWRTQSRRNARSRSASPSHANRAATSRPNARSATASASKRRRRGPSTSTPTSTPSATAYTAIAPEWLRLKRSSASEPASRGLPCSPTSNRSPPGSAPRYSPSSSRNSPRAHSHLRASRGCTKRQARSISCGESSPSRSRLAASRSAIHTCSSPSASGTMRGFGGPPISGVIRVILGQYETFSPNPLKLFLTVWPAPPGARWPSQRSIMGCSAPSTQPRSITNKSPSGRVFALGRPDARLGLPANGLGARWVVSHESETATSVMTICRISPIKWYIRAPPCSIPSD